MSHCQFACSITFSQGGKNKIKLAHRPPDTCIQMNHWPTSMTLITTEWCYLWNFMDICKQDKSWLSQKCSCQCCPTQCTPVCLAALESISHAPSILGFGYERNTWYRMCTVLRRWIAPLTGLCVYLLFCRADAPEVISISEIRFIFIHEFSVLDYLCCVAVHVEYPSYDNSFHQVNRRTWLTKENAITMTKAGLILLWLLFLAPILTDYFVYTDVSFTKYRPTLKTWMQS